MKKNIIHLFPVIILIASLSLFVSCQTQPKTIPSNLTPAEYFQRAQDASENENYKLAMRYYRKFQEVYPNNLEKNLWAEYEIAFLYHKMGDNKTAIKLFDKLIAKYKTKEAKNWPQAPRILAEKVKENILKRGIKK